jgi:hypothetical protein
MKVEKNSVVALIYSLRIPDTDGETDVVEVVTEEDPMYFIQVSAVCRKVLKIRFKACQLAILLNLL